MSKKKKRAQKMRRMGVRLRKRLSQEPSYGLKAPKRLIDLAGSSARVSAFVGLTAVLIFAGVGTLWIVNKATPSVSPSQALEMANDYLLALLWTSSVFVLGATFIAWLSSRSVSGDVNDVATSVWNMASARNASSAVPIRTLDELGELVRRFEVLRLHFIETLEVYRDARRKAEEADRNNTAFLTAIRHELRTPLNSILGFADILMREIDGQLNEGQKEDLETIRSAGDHLMTLFNDVLDLSAAALGRLSLEVEKTDGVQLIRDVALEIRSQLKDRPIELRVEVDDEIPPLFADPKRTRQILSNLASNALKFTHSGEIVFIARQEGDRVLLQVRDTGIGISRADIGRIFEEFQQVSGNGRQLVGQGIGAGQVTGQGAGLGLAISRQLAELQGGKLMVESELGKGSVFTLILDAWVRR